MPFLHGSRCEVPGSQTKRSHTDRARAAAGSRRGTRLCQSGQARSAVNALPPDEVGHFGHHECQPARAPENDATDRGAVLSDLPCFARLETLFAEAEEPCGSTYHGFRCWSIRICPVSRPQESVIRGAKLGAKRANRAQAQSAPTAGGGRAGDLRQLGRTSQPAPAAPADPRQPGHMKRPGPGRPRHQCPPTRPDQPNRAQAAAGMDPHRRLLARRTISVPYQGSYV